MLGACPSMVCDSSIDGPVVSCWLVEVAMPDTSGPIGMKYRETRLPDLVEMTKDELIKLLSELPDVPGDARFEINNDENGRDKCVLNGNFVFYHHADETPEEYAERLKAEQKAVEKELKAAIQLKAYYKNQVIEAQRYIDALSAEAKK